MQCTHKLGGNNIHIVKMETGDPVAIPSQIQKKTQPFTKQRRWTDGDSNPCLTEANASYQCLHDYNFDRERCKGYFANYKNCKNFWGKIMKQRRKDGIIPVLPGPEEREKILAGLT
ncbi:coiled-coil-helix-coiled-coil-helix domain-containing protein 7-like [Lytechinus variegatus]|uniref:coiled-coil-helix-coiled-coil-helix domain-containing protein 7-like n=1 Tax=Lytechinus variegatus TaxID=7654 RepID=UPI001BB1EF77|nr:coiled-coil-helix-coiled-coil-helix domain-containing protein 7-like [Lytechinus variegatus]